MRLSLLFGLALLVTTVRRAHAETATVDLRRRVKVSGAVTRFTAQAANRGVATVRLRGSLFNEPGKYGDAIFDLRGTPLTERPFGDRTLVSAEVRVSPALVGAGKRNWQRAHRVRLFLVDRHGRRLYLPSINIVDRPGKSDGWLPLGGRPTTAVPMPLGFTDRGFDATQIRAVGLDVEAFTRAGEIVEGEVELRGLTVTFEAPGPIPDLLPASAAVRAGEAARAQAATARLERLCKTGPRGLAVGVNLAWPTARSPDGEEMQLYGRLLDGATRWYDKLWDLGEADVAEGVRRDFTGIRDTFGEGALVRIWLFGDLRAGLTFGPDGLPTSVTARAQANMRVLLRLAREEKVVLLPALLDFGMADGVARTGPNDDWTVGERPDLVTDPRGRAALVAALDGFLKEFAAAEEVLAWDVMNEPENAVAVVTPAHFGALQRLVRDLVAAVQRHGGLATIGHRNAFETGRFWRDRVPIDLGQAHYYPLLETRPNPSAFGLNMAPLFGALPAGWGELPARPGRIAEQLATARRAGHRLFLFWSWRGHQEGGDGFAVQPHADEIRRALVTEALRQQTPAR